MIVFLLELFIFRNKYPNFNNAYFQFLTIDIQNNCNLWELSVFKFLPI